MDDRTMRDKIDAILLAAQRRERERWARRIVLSSVAAAGLTLGLGACPPELQPPGPDASALAAPLPDPGVRALYSNGIPRPAYAVEPTPFEPGAVAEYAAPHPPPAPTDPEPRPVAKYAVAQPKPAPDPVVPRPHSKYGVPPPDHWQPKGEPAADVVARYAVQLPRHERD